MHLKNKLKQPPAPYMTIGEHTHSRRLVIETIFENFKVGGSPDNERRHIK